MKQAIIKSGIHDQVKGQVKRNHGFRKWTDTTMIRKAVNIVDKETILGHKTGLDDKYYRPTTDELLEEYQKAVDNLTINEETRLKIKLDKEHDEIENLKEEMQSQRQSFEEFKVENHRIIKEAMAKFTARLSKKASAAIYGLWQRPS